MHFIASFSLASSLIALASAVPTLTERSTDFCPGQSHLTPEVKCSSGFTGCVAYEKGSEVCNGSKRFFSDCSAGSGLGSFFNCANGFKGCSTNPRICDLKAPPQTQETCAEGSSYYVCASGFKGCSNDPRVCNPKPEINTTTCPAGSSFYVCATNGFRGCSSNPSICDTTTSPPTTPTKPTDPITPPTASPTCPKGTWYVRPNDCSSGFIGCTSLELAKAQDICGGVKRFWGSCPADHGNYYNCANGFVGCTTDVKVCDKKGL